jgi:hypothetical protein
LTYYTTLNPCQTNAQNPFRQISKDKLVRSRDETTSSFFLKKISNCENNSLDAAYVFDILPLKNTKYGVQRHPAHLRD